MEQHRRLNVQPRLEVVFMPFSHFCVIYFETTNIYAVDRVHVVTSKQKHPASKKFSRRTIMQFTECITSKKAHLHTRRIAQMLSKIQKSRTDQDILVDFNDTESSEVRNNCKFRN